MLFRSPASFVDGTVVQLLVTLTNPFDGDRAIWRATGCDALTGSTCTFVMHGEKTVTIAVGCEVYCGSGLAEPVLPSLAPPRHHEGHDARKDR